jgi:hypothetical protein
MGLHSLEELVAAGSLTEHAAGLIEASVTAGLNILVSSGTQAGKTTMLNALCAAIPARERIVTVEEIFEFTAVLTGTTSGSSRMLSSSFLIFSGSARGGIEPGVDPVGGQDQRSAVVHLTLRPEASAVPMMAVHSGPGSSSAFSGSGHSSYGPADDSTPSAG